ncbi:PaaI family thioesterase [Sulfitobacter sp. G21635-S1]|uniref:PaaI family thioesterase n=1 Tax=Sulfitobacter sp. G21635-S1 TaxID=3014043 RepID=UPI0022AF84F7|nr:PaaI family thioesterase [Sulfitobacter sp. G21635-S1]MCZ4256986.1 PaaI family thioesterase [Sulfitobacter sp. G21635-S1]
MPVLIGNYRPDLSKAIASMPCSQLLGLTVIGFGEGVSAIELTIRPELTFDGRTVQGGIVGTLADYAAVSAATANCADGWTSSTTNFQVHNVSPARGERLVGLGRIVKSGRSQAVAAADIYAIASGHAELVATALASCKLSEPSPKLGH